MMTEKQTINATRLFLALHWIFVTSMQVEAYLKVFYITPAYLSTQDISPCKQLLNRDHNNSYDCSVMTLHDLLDYRGHSSNYRRVVFLSGMHIVNSTKVKRWFAKSNETIIGEDNVTVMCMSPLKFTFSSSRYVKISNVHFKNCFCCENERSTFTFQLKTGLPYVREIELERIQITGDNITGIKVEILGKSKVKYTQIFKLRYSIISTGGTGMSVLDNMPIGKRNQRLKRGMFEPFKMIISNVTFIRSCVSLMSVQAYSKVMTIAYEITDVVVIASSCASALMFNGYVNISLDSLSVSECQSQHVLKSTQSQFAQSTLFVQGYLYFYNNRGVVEITRSELTFSKATLKFVNNSVQDNSVWSVEDSSIVFSESNIVFENNYGQISGGITARKTILHFQNNTSVDFIGNHGEKSGAILLSLSEINFIGSHTNSEMSHCHFYHNSGSSIVSSKSKLSFLNTKVEFFHNVVVGDERSISATALFANHTDIVFSYSEITFRNNTGLQCGGIMATSRSNIVFNNSVANFLGNIGGYGGAISLHSLSVFTVKGTVLNTHLDFLWNRAQKGGAIFVDDSTYIYGHQLLISAFELVGSLTRLYFNHNVAAFGGNNIYGGWIDWSVNDWKHMTYNPRISNQLKFVEKYPSDITSEPIRICMCQSNIPDCNIKNWKVNLYPGQSIKVELVAVGQRFGTVVAHVTAELKKNDRNTHVQPARIRELQTIQTVQKTCTLLTYTVMSLNEEETLFITGLKNIEFGLGYHQIKDKTFKSDLVKRYPNLLGLLFAPFKITRHLKHCPFSFELNKTGYSCTCPQILTSYYGLSCDSSVYKILRSDQQWIGIDVTSDHQDCNNGSPSILAHRHCPFDYCKTDIKSLSIDFEHNNELCAFNRSGILCGGCEANFSRVLGSSKCKVCSNIMLIAIIPSTLLAGLLLILFLMILNLTVSVGTINGLIFYANIIQAQHATFFTSEYYNSFSRTFIALLNLDQGFESCLYDGLNSYIETWLQFCFPLYIWLLMLVIVVSSHYSILASKLFGNNAVQVLATLFLLTYAKIVRLVIDVVSFTTLTYPDGHTKTVWLYDGNIDYLKGKHIPLFIATLLLLVLISVPYTISLVSIQWLLKISHYRVMFWVRKMKPFFDAYTGPYRANHRYWTGLLLLVRTVLLVIFSTNRNNSPAVSIFSIAVFSSCLLAWLYFTGWIYNIWMNNCLELIFLLNLGLTSTAVLFEMSQSSERRSSAVIDLSVGITFVLFIVIILYHAQKQLFSTRAGTKIKIKISRFFVRERDEDDDAGIQLQVSQFKVEEPPKQVTYSIVALSKPLLEDEEENR